MGKRFGAAFSLAGEQRAIIEPVAKRLRDRGHEVFFYGWPAFVAELARPNLDVHLRRIYGEETRLLVPVLSADYARKPWTGVVELTVVRELLFERRDVEIMALRVDDTPIEGFSSLHGYVDVRGRTADDLADLVEQRLRSTPAPAPAEPRASPPSPRGGVPAGEPPPEPQARRRSGADGEEPTPSPHLVTRSSADRVGDLVALLASEDPLECLPAARELAALDGVVERVVLRPSASSGRVPVAAVRVVTAAHPEQAARLLVPRILTADRDGDAGDRAARDLTLEHRPHCAGELGSAVDTNDESRFAALCCALGSLGAGGEAWRIGDALEKRWRYAGRRPIGSAIEGLAEILVRSEPSDVPAVEYALRSALLLDAAEELDMVNRFGLRTSLGACTGVHADLLMGAWAPSSSTRLRVAAAEALGDGMIRRAAPTLSVLLGDPDEQVVRAAAHALARLRTPEAIDALLARRSLPAVQGGLAMCAHALGDRELAAIVDAFVPRPGSPRWAVFRALGVRRSAALAPVLRRAVVGADALERGVAALALARLGASEDRGAVEAAWREASGEVTERVLAALAVLVLWPERFRELELPLRGALLPSPQFVHLILEDIVRVLSSVPGERCRELLAAWRPFYGALPEW